jgi:cellulose synthase/poly-beta-1,6-N-acetylglucosamine synthase-like glycosyltransferase
LIREHGASATRVPGSITVPLVDQAEFDDAPTSHSVLPGRHHRSGTGLDDADTARDLGLELGWLSAGTISRFSGAGPVLAKRATPRARLRSSTFTDVLNRRDQALVVVMSGAWLACVVIFWSWWLEPAHRVGVAGLAVNSAVLAYVSGFPTSFIIGVNRLRKVNPEIAVPMLRVAFVVAHAPSEPWQVVRQTLDAMLAQSFPMPYDVWLCSERPTEEAINWCIGRGVGVSTREADPTYQREDWPRRTRCKEGNLAYFYDRWGYRSYDVVAQLDCDHVPEPTYLAEMVRPFSDPAIGYVAAPSVCDANASRSWAARGRLHKEATFHGPFQLGFSDGFAPLCIGSHYAVRTEALRQIGGLGPDLAEDFSTTFLLNAAGWHGAFAIDAEAHGDGPNTFAAMSVQEFQWARSLATILLWLVPRNLRRLPWVLRFRFLYALSYYFLLVSATAAGLALAPVAASTGLPWIHVNYFAFLVHWWSISIWLILITALMRRRGLLRPPRAPLVSWENWLYSLTRWPFVALGICAAVAGLFRTRPVNFRVTPKHARALEPLPVKLVVPFALISIASASAAVVGERYTAAAGYIYLSALAGVVYAFITILVPVRHAVEAAAATGTKFGTALWETARAPVVVAVCATALALTAVALYPQYAIRIFGL